MYLMSVLAFFPLQEIKAVKRKKKKKKKEGNNFSKSSEKHIAFQDASSVIHIGNQPLEIPADSPAASWLHRATC